MEKEIDLQGSVFLCPEHEKSGCWCVVSGNRIGDLFGDPFFPIHDDHSGGLCTKAGRYCTIDELKAHMIPREELPAIRQKVEDSALPDEMKRLRLSQIDEITRYVNVRWTKV